MIGSTILPNEKRPLLFAHRGISSEAPENTMAAFKLARDFGIPGIELDIHITKDGKLAVIHDQDTGRVAGCLENDGTRIQPGSSAKNRGVSIEASDWKTLSAIDIGSWKGSTFKNERIPLLSDLFEELGNAVYFDIELKSTTKADLGLEAAAAASIRAADGGRGLAERCIVSSFNPFALARFKAIMPEIKTAIIWCEDEGLPYFLRHGEGRWLGKVDFLKPAQEKVKKTSSFRWRKLEGYEFLPWTVDDPQEAQRILAVGASGVVSNRPHKLCLS